MNDNRYKVVKKEEHNEWLPGSPVKILRHQVVVDTLTSQAILQVKMFNLSDKVIDAVFFSVDCYDAARDYLSSIKEHLLPDLNTLPQKDFGDRIPIVLGSAKTVNVKIKIDKVVFSDESVWRNESGSLGIDLPEQEKIESTDPLIDQINQVFEKKAVIPVYWYESNQKFWRCTCGQANLPAESKCGYCGTEKVWLDKYMDRGYLAEEKRKLVEREELRKQEEELRKQEEELRKQEELLKQKEKRDVRREKRKKFLRLSFIPGIIITIVLCISLLIMFFIVPEISYRNATSLMESGQFMEARDIFESLDGYKDASSQVQEIEYLTALSLMESGQLPEAKNIFESLGDYRDAHSLVKGIETELAYQNANDLLEQGRYLDAIAVLEELNGYKSSEILIQQALEEIERIKLKITEASSLNSVISVGVINTVALQTNGRVVAAGGNLVSWQLDDISGWRDIVAVVAGGTHIIGLRSDGRVVMAGGRFEFDVGSIEPEDVLGWRNIVAVCGKDRSHVVGLRSDGRVVAIGQNTYGQCNVSGWRDIVAVSTGGGYTVGLRANGTVVATGENTYGQCDVSEWTDIVAVFAGDFHTVGLRSDGTVVATGLNNFRQLEVSQWTNIVSVSVGPWHTVGLRSDGTVVVAGENNDFSLLSGWRDIVFVSSGHSHTVGLRTNGTVVWSKSSNASFFVSWTDIVAVFASGNDHIVGLRADGTVVAMGRNTMSDRRPTTVSEWRNIGPR